MWELNEQRRGAKDADAEACPRTSETKMRNAVVPLHRAAALAHKYYYNKYSILLFRATSSVLTTLPLFYAMCMEERTCDPKLPHIIKGHAVEMGE